MSLRYPALVKLDDDYLTDEGRQPVQERREERSIEVDLASGRKKKYLKLMARSWSISWEMVPMHDDLTIDGGGGRNEIRAFAHEPGTHTLTLTDSYNTAENYTVFVTDYTETVTFRRGEGSRYSINLELEEQ
jgi:hypothetical protein